ncbi:protein MpPPR_35 [Marchantia polymorpha subsp. ruderalis]
MATLNFQHLQLRSLNQLQWRCVHGELDVKDRRSSVALSSTGFNDTNIIKSQLSSVQKVTSALENVEITKTSPDFDQVTVSGVSKQKGSYFNDQQKQWYKMMNEIRMTGDAVPVLEKQRKSKQSLTREGIVGTLVRLKQLRVWRSIMEICEWLAEQDWWQFGFEDYSLLMMAYGKEGEPEKAEELMKRLVTANHTPNIAIYTGLMEAYARTKMYSEAEALMQRLIKEGPPPTNLTYHTLMKAYVEGNRLDDAERVFSSMNDEVKADGRSYNLMIHAYGKAGRVAKAHELYQEMKHLKLNISIVTYNTLIASQKNCRDAESIYRQVISLLLVLLSDASSQCTP